jgi:hypothetical protein
LISGSEPTLPMSITLLRERLMPSALLWVGDLRPS